MNWKPGWGHDDGPHTYLGDKDQEHVVIPLSEFTGFSTLNFRVDMKLIQQLKKMQGKAADGVGDFITGDTPLPTLEEAHDMILKEAIDRWRPSKLSIQELADRLGVTKQYLYRRQRKGKIDLKSNDHVDHAK